MRWGIVAAAWLAIAAVAHADDDAQKPTYRAVIDRVDLEPAAVTGFRLRVYMSALSIEGHLLDLTDPKSIRLYVGSSELKAPYALGSYEATTSDTAVVIIVQATTDFADALPMIGDALDREVLATLPDNAQVALMAYGEASGTGRLGPIKALRGKASALASDGTSGEPALLDTIDRALQLLRKAKTEPEGRPIRKLILIVGDGRDRSGDKERVTHIGTRAAREGVRIHTIAYSPSDVRRPLLALGELSKKSFGTLRWPGRGHRPTPESWGDTFKQLHEEIAHQYVLTYFVSADDDVAEKRMHIVTVGRTEATSNEVKIPAAMCAGNPCDSGYCAADRCIQPKQEGGRGILGWLVVVIGIGVGAIVVLGVIGYFITKRQQTPRPQMPGVPQAAPGMPQMAQMGQMPQVAQPGGYLANGKPIPALLISNGPRAGERLFLRHGFLIGKQPGCDLQLIDGFTSSQHAQIAMDGAGNCRLYDRGSTNGTYVNGVRVSESQLDHGMAIKIGETELRFLAQ
jgi:hypothetical protein